MAVNYALEIKKANIPCHLDLENEIALNKNGLLTFTVRVHNGNIVDLNFTQYVNAVTYRAIKAITTNEFSLTLDY